MADLTDIADRLTPSVPIEITFGAQLIATGEKVTTIFGHKATSGGSGLDYSYHDMINVGVPADAQAEVEALAGAGAQIALMAAAFVKANATAGRSTFPQFRVVLLPHGELHFGPAQEAIQAVMGLRSDMIVSPYPLGDLTNLTTLNAFRALISGADRDLTGQFGSYVTVGTISALATALTELAAVNDRGVISAVHPDTNTASVTATGDLTSGSNVVSGLSTVAGINPGATATGTGIPAGTTVESVRNGAITLSNNATSDEADESIVFQNVVSQAPEIVAAYHAGTLMSIQYPYRPAQGLEVGGMVPAQKSSDRIYADPNGASEQILKAGGSPMRILPGGKVGLLRARVNYTLLPDGVTAANSYIDWIDLMKLQDYKEEMYGVLQNPPFNNNPGGALLTVDLAAKLNDEAIRVYMDFQKDGAFQAASTLTKKIVSQNSETSRGTLQFRVPANCVPGAYVFKGNIVGVTDFDFTL